MIASYTRPTPIEIRIPDVRAFSVRGDACTVRRVCAAACLTSVTAHHRRESFARMLRVQAGGEEQSGEAGDQMTCGHRRGVCWETVAVGYAEMIAPRRRQPHPSHDVGHNACKSGSENRLVSAERLKVRYI